VIPPAIKNVVKNIVAEATFKIPRVAVAGLATKGS
jgi:hypothetical protein